MSITRRISILFLIVAVCLSMNAQTTNDENKNIEHIVLGGGCFWCVEAMYERVDGVLGSVSGYAGGDTKYPSYDEVVQGTTGHIEVVRISFDSSIISLSEVLDWFWRVHDPTSVDRQGADVGVQYRSAIFYEAEQQREIIDQSREVAQGALSKPIVTQIQPLDVFYKAEEYHQDYYHKHPYAGYCQLVIRPKLEKLSLDG